MSNNINIKFPEGESYKEVLLRTKLFLNKDIKRFRESRILIITHNVVLRTIIGNYFNFHHSQWHLIQINNMKSFIIYKIDNRHIIDINRRFFIKKYKNDNKVNYI